MSRTKIAGPFILRRWIVLLIPILLLCSASAASTVKERRQVFGTVPAHLRPQLVSKLKLYVLLRSTHQWGRLYDLYSKQHLARRWPPAGMTRDEFITGNQQDDAAGRGDNLLSFKAGKVQFRPETADVPTRAIIYGCGEYYATKANRRVGRSRRVKSVIEATYEGGEWHLTDIVVNYRCEECAADRC
jgi:hypothetical protein